MNTTLTPSEKAQAHRYIRGHRLLLLALASTLVMGAGAAAFTHAHSPAVPALEQGDPGSSGRFAVDLTRAYVRHDFAGMVRLVYPDRSRAEQVQLTRTLEVQAQTDRTLAPAEPDATFELVGEQVQLDQHTALVRVVRPGGVDTWRWVLAKVSGRWTVQTWDKNP